MNGSTVGCPVNRESTGVSAQGNKEGNEGENRKDMGSGRGKRAGSWGIK